MDAGLLESLFQAGMEEFRKRAIPSLSLLEYPEIRDAR
jgi:hypothetical protein